MMMSHEVERRVEEMMTDILEDCMSIDDNMAYQQQLSMCLGAFPVVFCSIANWEFNVIQGEAHIPTEILSAYVKRNDGAGEWRFVLTIPDGATGVISGEGSFSCARCICKLQAGGQGLLIQLPDRLAADIRPKMPLLDGVVIRLHRVLAANRLNAEDS